MEWRPYGIKKMIEITEIFSLFEYHYDVGYSFPGEMHDFWECLYIIDGSVIVSGDERVYNLEKGEVIFHKPQEFHKLSIDSVGGAKVLCFSFSAVGELTGVIAEKVFKLSVSQREIMNDFIKYLRKNAVSGKAERKEDLYLPPFAVNSMYSQWVASFIERLILALSDSGVVSSVSTAADAVTFNKAVNYMNEKIYESPSVDEIASYCSISLAGLKRIFTKYAGMGIHKYFLKLKIKTAGELLENGNSVSDTAEILGFSSQAYFSKVFKRETGICASTLNFAK